MAVLITLSLSPPPVGGVGGVPDADLQDGAAAAAAAGGPARGPGERHGPNPAGQAHQRAASRHGRAPGIRLHRGQLRGAPDEDAQPHLLHAALCRPPRLPVEELGGHLAVPGSLPAIPELTYRGGALLMSDEGR